ncbi:hypothetical protein DZF91_01760 [Actinomadura logoneensis]|uniref:Subtilisin inhibitor domain-containing protein n=1 Tax=Actinomadura logoneensis TaxID=2293572 RepID=A0A372JTI6_9ACTN|nr:SSI family serine proteinase inhibitor [Actinomadura logoneensis]RFU43331.1 hypothetical protein DZF91_01760 [Actinomadura logoneensis]
MKHLITGVVVGALAVGLSAAPAQGAVRGEHEPAKRDEVAKRTVLRLTLTYPGRDTSGARTVLLRCDPPGGDHPSPARACAELAAHHGAFDHQPDHNQLCPMIYRPVIARASGWWRGRDVHFRKQYGNDCVMHSRTGAVFAF